MGKVALEAVLLLVDMIGIVLVGYWCVKNDGWQPGKASLGLFRFRDDTLKSKPPVAPKGPPPMHQARR